MTRTVAAKLGLKAGVRAIFVNAPETALAAINPPEVDIATRLDGTFDYIHFFARGRSELDEVIPTFKAHLKPTGMLWVSWPKGRRLGGDLTLPEVIRIGYDHGLVESKSISVDATWSALKFTHPIAGKVYRDRYGQLPAG
jgi:hypothetical protein